MQKNRTVCIVLATALLIGLPAWADDEEAALSGSIELLYRDVSQDGSSRKYDEDFDGLDSGGRLGGLTLSWQKSDSNYLDYARLEASGLGGDPFERAAFRLGRKDKFELSIKRTKFDYLYNLFELVGNEDGASWNSERQRTDVTLKIYPAKRVQLFFQLANAERSGDSLFMKDLNRDLFRLETPLDQVQKRYTVGANFQVGTVDIMFRQTLRRYRNQFDNTTENDSGLVDNLSALDSYEWRQRDSGGADLTTLKLHAPIGKRVHLTFSLFGTILGDETIESRVNLNASGTSSTGSCSVTGSACSSDAQCDSLTPGDACVAAPYSVVDGFSNADLEGESTMIDLDLTVQIASPLDLHLQYRSLDRDLDGVSSRDLNGDAVFEDEDGDGTPGSTTISDYEIDTISAILDYRPMRQLGLRAGVRSIDRQLDRDGFGGLRDFDFASDDDQTLILGLTARPTDWFRLNADYEDGDVTQPFNAVAAFEREHTRVRASFLPQKEMKIDLSYLDFENRNTAGDIREPGSNWDGRMEGTTWSASFWHKANEYVSYSLRLAEQEVENMVGVKFDTAGFATTEDGDSVFDNDNTQFATRIDLRCKNPWRGFLRYGMTESDGDNLLLGDASGLVNREVIDQEFEDLEIGAFYSFASGIWAGATYRDFEYDDTNGLLDYEGQIFTVRAGLKF